MAVDMMAIVGRPPAQATPPGGASSGVLEDGDGFADVIAAAMSDSPAEESPTADTGIDVRGLLMSLAGTPEGDTGMPVPVSDGSRLDRDAEAEGLQGAMASMLFGAVTRPLVSPPMQAMPGLATPVPDAVAVLGATDGAGIAEAQGGASVATTSATEVSADAAGDVAVQYGTGFALPGAESVVDADMADAVPVIRPQSVDSVTNEEGLAALAADLDAVPEASEVGSRSAGAVTPPVPTPIATPAAMAVAASAAEAKGGIDLSEVGPVEPRANDGGSAVLAADMSRPAAFAAAASTAGGSDVIAATDGQSLASAVANSVQQATLRGDHEMTLVLNPPDLGHLTVQITEDAAGGMSISIHATSSEAQDLLQQHLPALRSGLEQREVRVEELRVDQQAPSAGAGGTDGDGRESRGRRNSGDDGQPEWSPLASLRRTTGAAPTGGLVTPRSSVVDVRA